MKAFGVRLAAGVVTILTGAIMAAQSQKEKLAATESAWTEENIPQANAAMPVGLADLDNTDPATTNDLVSADPAEASALKPFDASGEEGKAKSSLDDSVRLVQHTEAADAAMALPAGTPSMSGVSESGPSMRLPGFDEMPPMDASGDGNEPLAVPQATETAGGAGPNFAIGLPTTADMPAGMPSQPRMSSIQFADTAQYDTAQHDTAQRHDATSSNAGAQGAAPAMSIASGNAPVNDLRGGNDLRGDFGGDEGFADHAPAMTMDSGASLDPSAAGMMGESDSIPMPTPGLADTANPASGRPAAMLAPVMPGSDNQAIRLADAPSSTIKINPDSMGHPAMNATDNHAPQAAIGFASSPKIVGADGSVSEPVGLTGRVGASGQADQFGGFDQASAANFSGPADHTGYAGNGYPNGGPTGEFAQTGGQFEIPVGAGPNPGAGGYPATDQAGQLPAFAQQNAPSPSGGQQSPNLRMGSVQTGPIGGTAMPSGYGDTQQLPQLPAHSLPGQGPPAQAFPGHGQQTNASQTNPALNNSIYHPAGFKQQNGASENPSGVTLASPGERNLDGPQAPSVIIEKRAPQEVKVGKPASFVITVRNVGNAKALNVQVFDRVPQGTVLTDATPRPNPKYQPELYWELGDLEAGQERTITLQLTPQQEGELGSVARVAFQAAASVRTVSTRPELKIVQRAPEKVLIGQQLEIELEVSNPGSGEATGVLLQEDVPEGLSHPAGKQLDNLIGSLRPGEVRRQVLRMKAVKPGVIENTIRVKADDGLETTHSVSVNVVSPDLKLALAGPSRRYLERQATYELRIDNVGTAPADNVDLSLQLDRGFTFVKTNFEGQYDPARHAVFWSLEELPAGEWGKVQVTLLPVEEGNRVLRSEASADLGVKTVADSQVVVDSLAELTFSIADTADPIEVGGVTTYEIRVANTGSRDDNNVNVALQLPEGLTLAEQGDFTAQGNGIVSFSPRQLLKANDEVVYRVKAKGVAPGRHLVKAFVISDQSNVRVTKEESIMVYADR
ncbi:DUF11 domain-containing protein [Roseiconus lacunae]|uniref:DUF11 domain-containing protein n=1 Tax=Roseiconus lacunae TaxID=2605694 RepID=UPI001E29D8AD|nr:DUF11 domain-containing protein [Roseiconus lacunae]MCD0461284.1 DUF11 domain-containing protein [Roseiconus lacunae]